MKLKIFSDKNTNSPILDEFKTYNNYVEITNDINIADVALVIVPTNLVSFVHKLLSRHQQLKIIVEITSYNFNSDRVYMLNMKMRDMCIKQLVNNVFGLDVAHIDISLVHFNLNLKAEAMNALSVVGMIYGWENYDKNLNLRFSYNNNSVHVSGYARENNFTMSIFISNTGYHGEFNETIKVFTTNDGIFTLDNDDHNHSYGERYGAAIQKVFLDSQNNNYYSQENLKLIIKSCISRTSSKRVLDKVPSSCTDNLTIDRLLDDVKRRRITGPG